MPLVDVQKFTANYEINREIFDDKYYNQHLESVKMNFHRNLTVFPCREPLQSLFRMQIAYQFSQENSKPKKASIFQRFVKYLRFLGQNEVFQKDTICFIMLQRFETVGNT